MYMSIYVYVYVYISIYLYIYKDTYEVNDLLCR